MLRDLRAFVVNLNFLFGILGDSIHNSVQMEPWISAFAGMTIWGLPRTMLSLAPMSTEALTRTSRAQGSPRPWTGERKRRIAQLIQGRRPQRGIHGAHNLSSDSVRGLRHASLAAVARSSAQAASVADR